MIPLDFVPGTHGHFLEYVCNRALGYTDLEFNLFTNLGTSHQRPADYLQSREVVCNHWFVRDKNSIAESDKIIRITFEPEDLLIVNYLSLLRSSDAGIDSNNLHINTKAKLNNEQYRLLLEGIYQAYPTLDQTHDDIPKNFLREFFKFSFKNIELNGIWKLQREMLCTFHPNQFHFSLRDLYNTQRLVSKLDELGHWLKRSSKTQNWLDPLHKEFLAKIDCLEFVDQCLEIVKSVVSTQNRSIPPLNLLQESWINAKLELIYGKEMPFHEEKYFTNTQDMLYYIEKHAPNL